MLPCVDALLVVPRWHAECRPRWHSHFSHTECIIIASHCLSSLPPHPSHLTSCVTPTSCCISFQVSDCKLRCRCCWWCNMIHCRRSANAQYASIDCKASNKKLRFKRLAVLTRMIRLREYGPQYMLLIAHKIPAVSRTVSTLGVLLKKTYCVERNYSLQTLSDSMVVYIWWESFEPVK